MADAFHIGLDAPGVAGVLPVPETPFAPPAPAQAEQSDPTAPDWSNVPEARATSQGPDGARATPGLFGNFWGQHSGPQEAPAPENADVLGSMTGEHETAPAALGANAPDVAGLPTSAPPIGPRPLSADEQMQEWLHPTTPEGQRVAGDLHSFVAGFHAVWESADLQNAQNDAIGDIISGAKHKLGVTLEDPLYGGYEDEAVQRVIAREKQQSWGQFFNPLNPESFFGGGTGFINAVRAEQLKIFDEKRQALAEKIQGDQAYDRAGQNADALALIDADTPAAMLGAKYSHQANVESAQAVAQAGDTWSARIANFAGGMAGGVRDPVNDLSLMVGAGFEPTLAKTYFPLAPKALRAAANITEAAARQALFNMGLTAAAEPSRQAANEQRGEEHGLTPALQDIGESAVFGFIPGAFIHGVKVLSAIHGPDSKEWIDEFIRQARSFSGDPTFSPDEPMTAAGRAHMEAVHEWEKEKGYPRGWAYSDIGVNSPGFRQGPRPTGGPEAAEPAGTGAAAAGAPQLEGPRRLLPGPAGEPTPPEGGPRPFPAPPAIPDRSRNRPSPSSITAEQVALAEADAAAMPPAIPGVPPSEHLRVYTEGVRHGENPDVIAPPEPPMRAPPAADANFLPPDHLPELAPNAENKVPNMAPGEVFEHTGKPVTAGLRFPARELRTDANTYQYKAGGDANGVTDRLQTVKQWSPLSAGNLVVHERLNGVRYVVDGHQRTGLANRIMDANPGQRISIPGFLFKEADGWTPEEVRAEAAAKNIREGLGDSLDIARILRDKPEIWDDSLPVGRGDMKEARGLANLSDEAWGMAVNGKPRRDFASFVGNMAEDKSTHLAIMDDLVKFLPRTQNEARMIIADAMQAGFNKTEQIDLFGTNEVTESLRGERSKVYAAAERLLESDKKIFSMLNDEAPRIIEAGNILADTNAERADRAGQLAQGLIKLAQRAGPISSALNRAARRVADGEAPKTAARAFLTDLPALLKEEGVRVAEITAPPKYDLDTPKGREEQIRDLEAEFMATQPGMFGEPEPEAPPGQPPAEAGIRQGKIGDKLASGEVLLTVSGRETTPFPKVDISTNRKAAATIKRADQWLMENALAEAHARGDDFNARQFEANKEKPQQADKDSAEFYLFDKDSVLPPAAQFLKPIIAAAKASPEPLDRQIGEAIEQELKPLIEEAAAPAAESEPAAAEPAPPPQTALNHAEDMAGRVAYHNGDVALIQGFSRMTGRPVYVGAKGDLRANFDIESDKTNLFTPEERAELVAAKRAAVAADAAAHAANPDGPFAGGARFAASPSVPENLASFTKGLIDLVGIKERVYLTTVEDAKATQFNGPFAAIGSAGVDTDTFGTTRRLPNGDHYIAIKVGDNEQLNLETVSHEVGHIVEKTSWKDAPPEVKAAVDAEYEKWRDEQRAPGVKARDLIRSTRTRETAKTITLPDEALLASDMNRRDSYWTEKDEWFADQVARWATSSKKPMTLVEKFFASIAALLRRIHEALSGYKPVKSMKDWLDSLSPTDIERDEAAAREEPPAAAEPDLVAQAFLGASPAERADMRNLPPDYLRAVIAHNEAQAVYNPIRDAFRKGKVSEKDFLAARKVYDAATKEFDRADAARQSAPPPAAEPGPEGSQQTLMPGVAPVTDAERARLGANAPLRGGNSEPPAGGLFDETARAQQDFLDLTPTEDGLKTREQMLNEAPVETVIADILNNCPR